MGFKKKQYAGFGVILAFMLVTAVVMFVSMNHMKKTCLKSCRTAI
nr:hypothetical protein [Heyndrickxia coagulans]